MSRRIALCTAAYSLHDVRQGIGRYAAESGNWNLTLGPSGSIPWLQWIGDWQVDGAIVYFYHQYEVDALRKLNIPVVNISGMISGSPFPRVSPDNLQIGRLAAEHLLARCLRKFAFFGNSDLWYSCQRRDGFCSTLRRAGYSAISLFEPEALSTLPWQQQQHHLQAWLKTLPLPCGLLASHDALAISILESCQHVGIRVPDDLAVLGVNDEQYLCNCSNPPLSSIPQNLTLLGYKAAQLLDSILDGHAPPSEPQFVPCLPVVTRRSTDTLAIEDKDIAVAARYVIEHLHEPFGVERLLQLTPISRTTLQAGFRKWLGCTPHEFINRTRVDRAKELFAAEKTIKVSAVMRNCGFNDPKSFRRVFQRLESITPTQYRKRALQQLRCSKTP